MDHQRPKPVHESDHQLIEKVVAGRKDLFNSLILRYQDYAFTIALRILKNKEEAEEAAQDAFVKAYRSLKYFNHKAKFSTWLFRIVFNTAISYKRKHRHPMEDINTISYEISHQVDDPVEEEDKKRFIQKAMANLSPVDSTIITLFYFGEYTLEEISDITGLKTNAAKVRLFRARKRLAEELKKILDAEALTL